jgi:hypothetical protein
MENALAPKGTSVDDRYEAAKRRNNYLKETPVEKPRLKGVKWKARPMGGFKPHGVKISGKLEF